MNTKKWNITIDNFMGGFAPGWYLNSYPTYGNKNMAGDMQNMNLLDPAGMTQGPGLFQLLNPVSAGPTTLINSILDRPVSAGVTYAIGGSKFYELSGSAPTLTTAATPAIPHTISGTSPIAEDLCYYNKAVYYSYNTNASANVGMYDLTRDAEADFSDSWAADAKSASISAGVPLPLEVGGNDYFYLGNKHRVSSYDGTTWTDIDLDIPTDMEIQDLKWSSNRLWIAANASDLAGSNRASGSLFTWDGVSDSWEDELVIGAKIGALHVKNGVIYIFYQDITDTGGYKLGFIRGTQVEELATFTGSLPTYNQITDYKGFITWLSDGEVWCWGAINSNLPAMTFQLADGGLANCGGIAASFGTPMVASYSGSDFRIAQFAGYDTNCYWNTMSFPVGRGTIEKVIVYFDTLTAGARADITLYIDRGATNYSLGSITETTINKKVFNISAKIENDCMVKISFSNGSTTNPVKINRIEIKGVALED